MWCWKRISKSSVVFDWGAYDWGAFNCVFCALWSGALLSGNPCFIIIIIIIRTPRNFEL